MTGSSDFPHIRPMWPLSSSGWCAYTASPTDNNSLTVSIMTLNKHSSMRMFVEQNGRFISVAPNERRSWASHDWLHRFSTSLNSISSLQHLHNNFNRVLHRHQLLTDHTTHSSTV